MKLHCARFPNLWVLGVILTGGLLVILSGCGASSTAPPSTVSEPPRASVPAASPEGSSTASEDGDLKRTSQGGNVTMVVTLDATSLSPGSSLRFTVVMDTHSVDLDSIDLAKQAALRYEGGKEVSPERWDAPKGGHHRSGTLAFPATVDGGPVIGPQTRSIELIVRDVAGVKERSFKWEIGS